MKSPLEYRVHLRNAFTCTVLTGALMVTAHRAAHAAPSRSPRASLAVGSTVQASGSPARGVLSGRVRDSTGVALPNALVTALGTDRFALTDGNGAFRMVSLAAGNRRLRVTRLGFAPREIDVHVVDAGVTNVTVTLNAVTIPLSQIVVTPGRFGISDDVTATRHSMSKRQIETLPQMGEDLLRSIHRLPGLSASDYSTSFRIRGGSTDQVLLSLDGLELLEPFHLKDFDAALSILDLEAVAGVTVMTGGFTPAFGNRLTGVVDVRSATPPPGRARSSVGVSVSNMRAMTQGVFGAGRGQWLATARRGYLDLILAMVQEDNPPSPRYHDVFAKVQYQLGDRHSIALHTLRASDGLTFSNDDNDGGGWLRSGYRNDNWWLTVHSRVLPKVSAMTLLAAGRLGWRRLGEDTALFSDRRNRDASVGDTRQLSTSRLKQDWTVELGPRGSATWGGELRHDEATYAYRSYDDYPAVHEDGRLVIATDSTRFALDRSGTSATAYASLRSRPLPRLTADVGVRYDHQTWTGEAQTVPRVSIAYDVARGATLRATWGRYGQAQRVHELQVYDGDSAFHPAETAEQRALGLEYRLTDAVSVRGELYDRRVRRPRPRFYNVDHDIEPFGELEDDRVRVAASSSRVRGAEIFLEQGDRPVVWSASYALSKGEDVVVGSAVPRPFDQRHTVHLTVAYAPTQAWRASAAWMYRSGWPFTPPTFAAERSGDGGLAIRRENEAYNTERLPPYHRLDVRATRTFTTSRGEISIFADLFNAYRRRNLQGYEYSVTGEGAETGLLVKRSREYYLPLIPSLGASWQF